MSAPAALRATFHDWRTVKGRKQLQLVFEVPLEQQGEVLRILGAPMPDRETWVAVALLKTGPDEAPVPSHASEPSAKDQAKPRRHFSELPRREQAVLIGKKGQFREWAGVAGEIEAADFIRNYCKVSSRAHLDISPRAQAAWDSLYIRYLQETGQMAVSA